MEPKFSEQMLSISDQRPNLRADTPLPGSGTDSFCEPQAAKALRANPLYSLYIAARDGTNCAKYMYKTYFLLRATEDESTFVPWRTNKSKQDGTPSFVALARNYGGPAIRSSAASAAERRVVEAPGFEPGS